MSSFKVISEKDLAVDSPVSWYLPLDTSRFSITSFRLTSFGRFITRTMVWKICRLRCEMLALLVLMSTAAASLCRSRHWNLLALLLQEATESHRSWKRLLRGSLKVEGEEIQAQTKHIQQPFTRTTFLIELALLQEGDLYTHVLLFGSQASFGILRSMRSMYLLACLGGRRYCH